MLRFLLTVFVCLASLFGAHAVAAQTVTVSGSLAEIDACCLDGFRNPGERLELTFLVRNTGGTAIGPLRFDVTIPDDTSLLVPSVTTTVPGTILSGATLGDERILVEWPSLAAGQAQTIRYRVRVGPCHPEAVGFLRQEPASVFAGPGFVFQDASDPIDHPVEDITQTVPALAVTKSDGGVSATVGDVVTYQILLTNDEGSGVGLGFRTAPTTVLRETVPVGSIFVPASSSPGWTCVPAAGPAGAACTRPVGVLDCESSASATFAVRVAPPFALGQTMLQNTATLDSELALASGSDTTPLVGIGPDPRIAKTANRSTVGAGQAIVYTLAVSNVGTTAGVVTVTEPIPAGTSFFAASSTPGWTCAAGSCSLSLGSLAAGASVSAAFAVTTALPLPSGLSAITNTATVASPGDLSLANNSASASVPIAASARPDLVAAKSTSASVAGAGDVLVYTLGISNTGAQVAGSVSFTETVPAATSFVAASSSPGWVCVPASGPAGATCTLGVGSVSPVAAVSRTFAVRVADPIPSGVTAVTNAVTATSATDLDSDPADNASPPVTTPIDPADRPDLVATKSTSATLVGAGDLLRYTLTITNTGRQVAGNVTLTETVPEATVFEAASSSSGWGCTPPAGAAGATCLLSIGSVAPGAVVTRTFSVRVLDPIPSGVTGFTNTVTARSTIDPDADPSDNTSPPVTTPVDPADRPDLVATKSTSAVAAAAGDLLVYTLTVSNTGHQVAGSVSLTETVPPATTFVAASSSAGWSCAPSAGAGGATCTLAIGSITPGTPVTRAFAVRVDDPIPSGVTGFTNVFVAASSIDPDSDPPDNTSPPVVTPIDPDSRPDLEVVKTTEATTASAGEVLVHSVTVTNEGGQVAGDVVVTETVPEATAFRPIASSPGWSCVPPAGDAGATCTIDVGDVAPGESVTRLFAVQVANPLPSGVTEIANSVTVSSPVDPDGDPDDDPPPVETPIDPGSLPDLEVTKTAGSPTATAGELIVYTVTVRNVGAQVAGDVTVTETVPVATSFVAASSSPGWTCAPPAGPAGATCTTGVGDVAPGSPVTRTFAVRVDDPLPSGLTAIANAVTVSSSSDPDGDPDDDPPPVETPIDPDSRPDLEVVKTAGSATVHAGEVLVYTLRVRNVGRQVAGSVVLIETVPAATRFEPASSSPGWSCLPPAGPAGAACLLEIGDVAPGATVVRSFAVRVDDPLPSGVTAISNSVRVSSPIDPDGDPDDDPPPVETPIDPGSRPDLEVVKTTASPSIRAGEVLVYTVTVTNLGHQVAGAVVVTETVPVATTFEAPSSSPGWACTPVSGAAGATCTLGIGNVPPGAVVARVFALRVADPVPAGVVEIVNRVTVASPVDPDADPDDDPPPHVTPVDPGDVPPPPPPPPPPGGVDVTVAATASLAGRAWTVTGIVSSLETVAVPVDVTVVFDPDLLVPLEHPETGLGASEWTCERTASGTLVGRCGLRVASGLLSGNALELPIRFEIPPGVAAVWATVEAWPVGAVDVAPDDNVAAVSATLDGLGVVEVPTLAEWGMAALVLSLAGMGWHTLRRVGPGAMERG